MFCSLRNFKSDMALQRPTQRSLRLACGPSGPMSIPLTAFDDRFARAAADWTLDVCSAKASDEGTGVGCL